MKRIAALRLIADEFAEEPIIASCGATSRELAAMAYRPNHLYMLDSMGLPSSLGLGLSLALESSRFAKIVVVEGDGGMLMNLSALATIGLLRPAKLVLIVLDNGVYASTGGQISAASVIELDRVAESCGLNCLIAADEAELQDMLKRARHLPGPLFLRARISPENAAVPYLQEDPAIIYERFRAYVMAHKNDTAARIELPFRQA